VSPPSAPPRGAPPPPPANANEYAEVTPALARRVVLDGREITKEWCCVNLGDRTEADLVACGGWIDVAGIGRAVEHFQRQSVEVVALVPAMWHASKGFWPEFPNTRAMSEDNWFMLDLLVGEGTVVLLPERNMDDGEVLLLELLRVGFTGALVTNDTAQFGKALAVCPAPAVAAAAVMLEHHLLPYTFEGPELVFVPGAAAGGHQLPWQPGFRGMTPGCPEAHDAAVAAEAYAAEAEAQQVAAAARASGAAEAAAALEAAKFAAAAHAQAQSQVRAQHYTPEPLTVTLSPNIKHQILFPSPKLHSPYPELYTLTPYLVS